MENIGNGKHWQWKTLAMENVGNEKNQIKIIVKNMVKIMIKITKQESLWHSQ
jgi:hypothetical protein